MTSISNFGQTGPYRDYKASELVLFGMGGEMHSIGMEGREPLKQGGNVAQYEAGAAAATATMGALWAADRDDEGQHLDISIFETQLGGVDRRHAALMAYAYSGRISVQQAGWLGAAFASGTLPCADGYIEMAGGRPSLFPGVIKMLGNPEFLQDPKWLEPGAGADPELNEEFNEFFIPWLMERTKREVWEEGQKARVLCGPLYSMSDLLEDPQFVGRGFWPKIDHPYTGPGLLSRRPDPHGRDAATDAPPGPRAGSAHRGGIRTPGVQPGRPHQAPGEGGHLAMTTRTNGKAARLPLEGIRVLDFCVVWAGPFATQLLADLGAEVIKVENIHHWQPMTRGFQARPAKDTLPDLPPMLGGYPDSDPGPRPWNRCPGFNNLFRNKKSMTLDLRQSKGRGMLKRLVKECDIFYENNVTETMEKLDISYELAEIHPARHHNDARARLRKRRAVQELPGAGGSPGVGNRALPDTGVPGFGPVHQQRYLHGGLCGGCAGRFHRPGCPALPEAHGQGAAHRTGPGRERGQFPVRGGYGLHPERSGAGDAGEPEHVRVCALRGVPGQRRQQLDKHHRLQRRRVGRPVPGDGQPRLVQGRTLLRPVRPVEERRSAGGRAFPLDCSVRKVRGLSPFAKPRRTLGAGYACGETPIRTPI